MKLLCWLCSIAAGGAVVVTRVPIATPAIAATQSAEAVVLVFGQEQQWAFDRPSMKQREAYPEAQTKMLQELSRALQEQGKVQQEHSRALQEQTKMLQGLGKVQQEHSRALQEQGKVLHEHSRALQEQGKVQQEHSRVLQEQGKVLQEHSTVLQEHSMLLRQQGAELRGFIQQSFVERTRLNATELDRIAVCASQSMVFFPSLECTGFFYKTKAGSFTVVTAAHCVADCWPAAGVEECENFPSVKHRFEGIRWQGDRRISVTCGVRKVLKQRNTLSADVALLACTQLSSLIYVFSDVALRSHDVPRMHSPVAVVGVAQGGFGTGKHHYAAMRSMRTMNTCLVASAGHVGNLASGIIQLASKATMPTEFYEVGGFTEAAVPPGMSGGVVLDGSCRLLGVAVATAEHGIFAPLHGVDKFLDHEDAQSPVVVVRRSASA